MIVVAIRKSGTTFGRFGLILLPNDESIASTIPDPLKVRLLDETSYWYGHFISAHIKSESSIYFLRKHLKSYHISHLETHTS